MKCIAYCGVVLMMLLAMISVFLIGNNPETTYQPARVTGQTTSFVPERTGALDLPKAVHTASFHAEPVTIAHRAVLKAGENQYLDLDPYDFEALRNNQAFVLDAEREPEIAVNSHQIEYLHRDQTKPENPQPNFIESAPGKHLPYGRNPHYTRPDFV